MTLRESKMKSGFERNWRYPDMPSGKKRPASAPAKPAWGSAAGRSWSQFKAGHKAMQVSTEYIETGYVEKAKILREYKRIPEDHADFKAGFTGCSAYSTGPYGKARTGNRR